MIGGMKGAGAMQVCHGSVAGIAKGGGAGGLNRTNRTNPTNRTYLTYLTYQANRISQISQISQTYRRAGRGKKTGGTPLGRPAWLFFLGGESD